MARPRKSKKNTKSISVNFTGVESRVLLPEDDYAVKVSEVTKEEGSKGDYLKWVFEVTEGKLAGNKVYFNTSLTEQSLWNLKNLLVTLGVEVPNDELDIDLDELVDLEMMAAIAHENYEGKRQARLVDFYALDEEAGNSKTEEEEEEEKPVKKTRAPKKAEEEEEEEEEKPVKGKKVKKVKALEPMDASEVEDLDEEELEEVIEKYSLDVEIDELKTMRKKISAVMDALEEAGMLTE